MSAELIGEAASQRTGLQQAPVPGLASGVEGADDGAPALSLGGGGR